MKTELCQFSGLKIYPGHGSTYVRGDSKTFKFLDHKCRASFLMKRNPRKIRWTAIYRRLHKKGQIEESSRRRTKRGTRVVRAVGTMTLAELEQKRTQSAQVRAAARDAALREVKERKAKARAAASKKPAAKAGAAKRR